ATCEGFFFREQETVVVGGGDSALEEALFLTRFASKVPVVHRRSEFRASKIMAQPLLDRPKLEAAWNNQVARRNETPKLEAVARLDTVTGVEWAMPASGLFVAIGHDPRSELVTGIVDADAAGFVLVDHPSTRTNLPGVFAAGDLVDHTYRQAITAAGTGCAAAQDAQHYLSALDESNTIELEIEEVFA